MTLLAQISDPHLRTGDEARTASLAAAAKAAAAHAPDAVLVSGDIADTPSSAEYDMAAEALAALPVPVHVLAGNHDDPDGLRAQFGQEPQYAVRVGDLRLVVVDTTVPGRDDGALGEERLAWLADRLVEDTAPTVVAVHHAPLTLGVAGIDDVGVPRADREALGGVLARFPHVVRVAGGHVHRAALGMLGPVPVFACPSTSSQLELDFETDAEAGFSQDPPAFALHLWRDGGLTTHVVPYAP